MQRSRSSASAPHSPLTRHPFGRFSAGYVFAIGLLLVGLSRATQAGGPVDGDKGRAGSSTLTVCQAIERPGIGGGEMVRVRGRVLSGFEAFVLWSDACETDNSAAGFIWLEVPGEGESQSPYARYAKNPSEFVLMQRDGKETELAATLEWFVPLPVEFHSDANWARLQSLLHNGHSAIATIVGRLDHEEGSRVVHGRDGVLGLTANYGHLNGYSRRLVIERVEDVKRRPR